MTTNPYPADLHGIVDVDRRITAAVDGGRGIKFTRDQLDLLVQLGVLDLVSSAKDKYLKDKANCRKVLPTSSTSVANIDLVGTSGGMDNAGPRTLPSSGMMRGLGASAAEARARATFGQPAPR